jgi:hypothetical protein
MTGLLERPRRSTPTALALALLTAAVAAGCGSSGGQKPAGAHKSSPTPTQTTSPSQSPSTSASALAPTRGAYSPSISPSNFVATIDNRYFPLKPGTGFHYRGVAEDGKTPQTDDMVVTHATKMILGVKCTVVRDTVRSRGRLLERTFDWYAQDKAGNVWYMGEDAREVHHGRLVRADDSWEGGRRGAKPGIIMPGDPRVGDSYRQEYYPGSALDQARVLGPGGSVTVPAGTYKSTLLTVETSPIDPARERKYYVVGLGDIKEQTVAGNHERIVLVRITHGA